MNISSTVLAWLVAILMGSIVGTPVSASEATQGREIYIRMGCWSCHGYEGQGGIAGPKLAPEPLPLEAFIAIVRTSVAEMPAYRLQVISNEELADVYAYLLTVVASPDPDSIPLLR